MSTPNFGDRAEGTRGAELLPLAVDEAPGIYYVLLHSGPDTVSIARESFDEHVREGDALYLAPQHGAVVVMRQGEEVARITIA